MKLGLIAILAALVLPGAAGAKGQWNSDVFHNPSGNIVCDFYASAQDAVTFQMRPELDCYVHSNSHQVTVTPNGAAADFKTRAGVAYAWKYSHGPVLQYGQRWQSHQFTCLSTYQGVRCWTADLSHGFFVSAWMVKVW